MKKLKLSLSLVALTLAASSYAAITWDCGPDPNNNMAFTSDVKGTLENIAGEQVLRIYGSGKIADFNTYSSIEGTMTVQHTYSPWYEYERAIDRVIVESGVEYIGQNTFKFMDALKSVQISSTVNKIGKGAFNKNYSGAIYFSCTNPAELPDASETDNNSVPAAYYQNAKVYVPIGMHDAYAALSWFEEFDDYGNLVESLEAGAVVSVSLENADKNTVQFFVEVLDNVARYEIVIKDADGNVVRHYYAYYSVSESKWVLEPIALAPAPRRLPSLRRDEVTRTTEVLQIDITGLNGNAEYSFTISGYDETDQVVCEKSGAFQMPAYTGTAINDQMVNDPMVNRFNLLGQPVDETYRGIIITNTGKKILQ